MLSHGQVPGGGLDRRYFEPAGGREKFLSRDPCYRSYFGLRYHTDFVPQDGSCKLQFLNGLTRNATVRRAGRREGREFPYLMAQWIGIHTTEFLTTPSARLGLELDHLIALTRRNQITLIRTRDPFGSGPPHPKGLILRLRVRLRIPVESPNSLTHPVNGYHSQRAKRSSWNIDF